MEQVSILKIAKENTHLAQRKTTTLVATYSMFGLGFCVAGLESYIPFTVFICLGIFGRVYSSYLDIAGKPFLSEECLHSRSL